MPSAKPNKGINDLKTLHPLIAKEAFGWDPSKALSGSHDKKSWLCKEGHDYQARIIERTAKKRPRGCSYCAGKKVWVGFNDLKTLFPEIAKEADGWDPSKVVKGTSKVLSWKCIKGHKWKATGANRTTNETGCPECCEKGFNPGKPAWLYLLERKNEQQIGITNYKEDRLKYHSYYGWTEIEITGPHDGQLVQDVEAILKKWLRKNIGVIPGTYENWYTKNLKVNSLKDLKIKSNLQTLIF